MKKIVPIILAACFASFSMAAEYNFILPNPPGSSSDTVARSIAEEYNRQTGNNLVIDYAPGGDHLVAAAKFKNQSQLAILLGSTTLHVFNYVTKESLPYSDDDFRHVGWIGWAPHIWYVRSDSRYQSLDDVSSALKKAQRINVGVDGMSTQSNVMSVRKFRKDGTSMEMIVYKGSPQALNDVLGGHVDMAVGGISAVLTEQADAGKIRILGTTNNKPATLAGHEVPVSSKALGVEQFNGGFLLSLNATHANTIEGRKLADDLHRVINSQIVKDKLSKIGISVDGGDGYYTGRVIQSYRATVKSLK